MTPIRPAHRPLPAAVLAAFAVLSPLAAGVAGAQDGRTAQSAPGTPPGEEYVTTTRTNVREQPSARAARIELIDGGSRLRVTGRVADAPWYSVVTQSGKTGFVAADLLRAAVPSAPAPSVPAVSAPSAVPVPAATAAPAAAPAPSSAPSSVDPVLLERLDRLQARLDAIESKLSALPDLQGLVERGKGEISRLEALDATVEMAKGVMDTLSTLQDQVSTRFNEQREEFDRIGDRLKSVEDGMQPTLEWLREWKDKTPPLAEEAKGWFSTATGTMYGWIGGWLPWGANPPPPSEAGGTAPR